MARPGCWRTSSCPLVDVLARMERTGIAVDSTYLTGPGEVFDGQVQNAAAEAYAVIGREVNLGSPKQLQEVLFDQLGMPKTKRIKTGYTTDAAALTELFARTEHPFLQHLLAHRDAIRLRQTVEGLLRSVAADGRIHTTFQQTIAATGRLSSTDPNLQNIPIRTEDGRRIRRAFVVGDGYETLLTADYSQIEMRIMAHLSGDEGLIEAFRSGRGPAPLRRLARVRGRHRRGHARDALEDQGDVLRARVRAVAVRALAAAGDHGERGGGPDGGLLLAVRRRARLPHGRRRARRGATGYTATILGRRRYLPDLTSDNRQRRDTAERMALNAPIQGSAADLIKVAMLGVDRELDRARPRVAAGPAGARRARARGRAGRARARSRRWCGEQMGDGAPTSSVPLDVSVGVGATWHEAGH